MNTPKRHVSVLERFPPDIWAHLAWYLSGEHIGRLMMTGSTLLSRRLKSPTVVKSVELGSDFIIFQSFPAFLRELPSLEELVIHSRSYEWSDKLGMRIDLLPSGLRKLDLSGNWTDSACKLFGEPGERLMVSKHLPCLDTIQFYCLELVDYSCMTTSQTLTSLSLVRWDGDVELPSSLTHFDLCISVLSSRTLVSKLPPRLEFFQVSEEFVGADLIMPLLPPSIQNLSLASNMEYTLWSQLESSQKLLEHLPKSLTWLSSYDLDFGSNPQMVSLLPATLTGLRISTAIPCSLWQLLPPQLTDLTFGAPESLCTVVTTITDNHGNQHEVRSVPFDSLPRAITTLRTFSEGHFCGPPNMLNQSYFPPNLTHLILPNIHVPPESAKLFPSSLTYLIVGNFCERLCQHLSNSIKTLKSDRTLMSPNLIKFLPKSLTYLHLSLVGPHYPWFDYNTGKETKVASNLPEYTIHERCTSNSFDWKDSSLLPPTLTHLCIHQAGELGDSYLMYQQLPNLLNLDFFGSKHFTDISIPILPSNLRSLNLCHSSSISGKAFPFLPRSLADLDLSTSESIFDSDIQHLPRTLKTLRLRSAIHLTDLGIPDLPPHLSWLDLGLNSQITPSSLPYFPIALRSSLLYKSVEFPTWAVSRGVVKQK